MALTDVQVINLGLSKIASSRIKQITPPLTSLEQFMAAGYPNWRDQEIAKRRWVCAMQDDYTLTLNDTLLIDTPQPFKFRLPNDCLRALRDDNTEWKQRGRYVYSAYSALNINYVKRILEADFDTWLTEVVACRVAQESCEYVTQSNTKKQDADNKYRLSVIEGAQQNAYIIGPEDLDNNDNNFSWITERNPVL